MPPDATPVLEPRLGIPDVCVSAQHTGDVTAELAAVWTEAIWDTAALPGIW